MNCVEITTSGKQCREPVTKFPVGDDVSRCYYHDKVWAGLTTQAEAIISVDDDDDF